MKKLLLSFGCLLGTLISNGQCVGALDLPSSSDYVQFVNPFYSYTNEITVEGWVYMDGTMNSTPWIGQATAGLDNMGTNVWHWHGAGANELSWQVNDNGTWRGINSTTMTNGWHHVATVADNASVRVYIDGVLNATGPGISGAMISNSNSEIHIGHDVRFAAGTGGRNGDYKIGELRVWNVARTQTEIAANMSSCLTGSEMGLKLYNKLENGIGGTATSAVGPNGSLVSMNTVTSWVMGSGSECCTPAAALNFDGVDDYVDVTSPANIPVGNSPYTIEAKIKPTVLGVEGIAGWGSYGNTNQVNALRIDASGNIVNYWWGSDLVVSSSPVNMADGNWHHVAATFDGTIRKIYLDGVLKGSDEPAAHVVPSAANFRIGSTNNGEFFNGGLDEVRIWDVARTQCEINSYMNCEIPGAMTALVANYHFNQGVDAGNNSLETSLTDASLSSNIGTLNNFALNGTTSNWIAPGGVVSGFTTTAVCPLAAALNFDGINDYVTTNIDADLDAMPVTTWESWIYPTDGSFGSYRMIMSMEDGGWDRFVAINNGNFVLGYTDNGWYTNVPVDLNQWQHIAVVYSGNNIKFYKNGVEYVFGSSEGAHSSSGLFTIGANQSGTQNFQGNMDDVRIWNVGRTNCELISYMNCEIPTDAAGLVANFHFNQGLSTFSNPNETTLADASVNVYNGTLTNFALNGTTSNWIAPGGVVSGFTTTTACSPAAALNFDGVNDYIAIPSNTALSMTNAVTIESWFKTTGMPAGEQYIMTKSNDSYYVGLNVDGFVGRASFYISGVSSGWLYSTSTNLNDDNWHHIASTYDGAIIKIYIDGILENSVVASGAILTGPNDINLGCRSNGSFLKGSLDEVRIWDVARTQCEINTYMNSEISTSMGGLLTNYHFNQGVSTYSNPSETTLTDASGNGYNGALSNFALTGTTSNWVAPGGVVNGYTTTLAPSTITVNSGAICVGQSFTMTPSGAATFTYSNGSDVAMPTADATYTVSGTAVSGCPAIDAIASVTVNSLPVIVSETGSVTVCGDATGTFSLVANNTSTYSWQYQFNSGSISLIDGSYGETGYTTAVMQIPTLESEGWDGYDITCLLTSTEGCTVVSSPKLITVNALPTVTVSSGTICSGESFTMTPGGAITYTYSNGSNVVMPTADDTYTVTGTDVNGCENTAVSSLTVNALPTLSVSSTSTLICTGETATLSVTGASTYTWSTTESTSEITVSPTAPTTYTVNGTDGNGCMNTTTILQDVSLCTGLANNSASANVLSIFPNPSNGMFTVKSDMDLNLNLTNALGQVIQAIQLNDSNNHQMNVNVLSNGVYFITGQNNNKSVKQKVIVTK
ncbi:MAG: LamG-like jellyroll fold domain-containing protein [Bacteroidota bacterium]